MKKYIVPFLMLSMAFVSIGESYGATGERLVGGMGNKFVRGIVNTFTGWIEIPAQIVKGYNTSTGDKLAGATIGIFKGVWHGVGRTISGVGEMASFWAADPDTNEGVGVPLDADYAWQTGVPYDMAKPSVTEATFYPIGNKLMRGAGNALLGFCEFPGQIAKGTKLKSWDIGIIKGLWYWFSREVDGIYDIMSFPLPNPRDTMGLAFDEKWPWDALTESVKH